VGKKLSFKIEAVRGELDTMESTLRVSRSKIAEGKQLFARINKQLEIGTEILERAKRTAQKS
jgi:hypothetical protein